MGEAVLDIPPFTWVCGVSSLEDGVPWTMVPAVLYLISSPKPSFKGFHPQRGQFPGPWLQQ